MTDKPTQTDAELQSIIDDADAGPPTDNEWLCLECGRWTPWRHEEAHDHADGCKAPAIYAARRDWKARLNDYMAKWGIPAGRATAAPAQPAAQLGVAYAEMPTSNYAGRVYEEGFLTGTCPLYTADQMRAFADATHALRVSHGQAPAQAAPQREPVEMPAEIEQMATGRYKVVPSHESMFHRWAVVAGTGAQQLYLGREVECQNMARKFAGAFLDGAFAYHSMTAAPPTQPEPQQEPSCTSVQLAEMVLSDCGHSSNYTPLLDRVAARIDAHVERCLESKKTPQQEPFAWHVCSVNSDGSLSLEHAAAWEEAAHEHINDAITEHDIEGAGSWVVRPAYHAPQPSPTAQAEDSVQEDAARYRWLREHSLAAGQGSITVELDDRANGNFSRPIFLAELDAAIDAARAAQEGKSNG